MKQSQAAKIWTMFATAYAEGLRWLETHPGAAGGTQLDDTAALYQRLLLDLDFEHAEAAVVRLIATWAPTSANRYPPIPVVRAAVLEQQAGRARTGIEAWGDLHGLTGSYERERLDEIEQNVRRCIEDLGWVVWSPYFSVARGEFQRWRLVREGENEASDRARFCELYDRLASTARADAIVGRLAPPAAVRRTGPVSMTALMPGAKDSA